MGVRLNQMQDALAYRDQFGFFDQFDYYTDGQRWTKVTASSGTVAFNTFSGGTTLGRGMIITTTGGTSSEAYLPMTNAPFIFGTNVPLYAECNLQYAEADTNNATICFGFVGYSGGVASGLMTGTGMVASFSGAVIFKVAGSTLWQCQSSIGTTNTIQTSDITAGGTAANVNSNTGYQRLAVQIRPNATGGAEVVFMIDMIQPNIQYFGPPTPRIKQQIANTTGFVNMQVVTGARGGSATAQPVYLDYAAGYQIRNTLSVGPYPVGGV